MHVTCMLHANFSHRETIICLGWQGLVIPSGLNDEACPRCTQHGYQPKKGVGILVNQVKEAGMLFL